MAVLTTLPIPPNISNVVGDIPQPFKGLEVKQDILPVNTKAEDVLIKNIDKEILDKAFQLSQSYGDTYAGGPQTVTHTLTFTMSNVKITAVYLYAHRDSAILNSNFPYLNIYVNDIQVRVYSLGNQYPSLTYVWDNYVPIVVFDNDVFVGTTIKVEVVYTNVIVAGATGLTSTIYIEGYQLEGYQFEKK